MARLTCSCSPSENSYTELKRYDVARDSTELATSGSLPTPSAYERSPRITRPLASANRWKETLDDFLAKVEDHGLDHARIRVQIANDFMEHQHGRTASLRPAAVETWAPWAKDLRRPMLRRTEGLEKRRLVDPPCRRSLSRFGLDELVPILDRHRPRRHRGGLCLH